MVNELTYFGNITSNEGGLIINIQQNKYGEKCVFGHEENLASKKFKVHNWTVKPVYGSETWMVTMSIKRNWSAI